MGRKRIVEVRRRVGPLLTLWEIPAGGRFSWRVDYYDAAGRNRTFAEGREDSREFAESELQAAVDRFLHRFPDAKPPQKSKVTRGRSE